jgi:hypothetical protein
MSKYLKLILKIVGVLVLLGVIVFIGIQFVPVERTNPPVVSEPQWDSPQTRALAEQACFDCHSNETKWPWYAKIAPISWVVAHDVEEGRAELNFSEWGTSKHQEGQEVDEDRDYDDEGERGEADERESGEGVEPDEIVEEVEEGKMPLPKYLLLHPEARLNAAELQAFINGLKATFGGETEGAMVR